MADAFTALIGAIIMIGYILLIAAKLAAPPLWICGLIGLALMLWAFWGDDWKPLFNRQTKD
jgi:glucose dehydrogenase